MPRYRQKHEEDKRLVDSHCVMAGLTLQTSTEAETQLPQGSVIQRPIANEPSAADHEAAEKDSERLRLLDSVVCISKRKYYVILVKSTPKLLFFFSLLKTLQLLFLLLPKLLFHY